MKRIIFFVFVVMLASCGQRPTSLPANGPIVGLATPVSLIPGTSEIYLTDYFSNPDTIDSLFIDGKKITLPGSKERIICETPQDAAPLMEMKIWSGGFPYSVLMKKTRKVTFHYIFDPKGKTYQKVQLKGEFNGWTPSRTELVMKEGKWETILTLNPGSYQYLLVLNGQEKTDPANPDSVDNNMGKFNSMLKAGLVDENKLPFLYTAEKKRGKVYIGIKNGVKEFFIFWQNSRLDQTYYNVVNEGMLEVNIPEESTRLERTFIRVYAFNESGLSNDILIPLVFGRVLSEPELVKRSDREANIIYNVFVDRFNNGNKANDEPMNIPEVLPKADFFGGDISGITEKLKDAYFHHLGINTLWISPVIKNPKGAYGQWKDPMTKFSAYHGYWPISFTQVDNRFGTGDELKKLVREAHYQKMNVLLDFVAHHVHQDHPVYKNHPEWTTSLYLPDGTMNTERWDEYRLTTWFDVFLPTLDLSKSEAARMLSDSATWWIKEYNLDGFRHDALKHVPEYFWRMLTQELKDSVMIPEKKTLYQIGETYGSPELISSYVGSGMVDGQFDFNVYDAAIGVFGREADPFTRLDQTLHQSFDYYGNHNLMGYITGNQDRARFISYAGGSLGFDENAKLAGWKRDIEIGDSIGYTRLSMLTAFNMTIPGVPVIYYGDEIGIPGGNDPDSRRMMRFDNLNSHEIKTMETVKKLTKIRKDNLSMIYGDFYTIKADNKTYVFLRKYFDEVSIIIFNKNNENQSIDITLPDWAGELNLEDNFGNKFTVQNGRLSIDLPAWSFEVLTTKK